MRCNYLIIIKVVVHAVFVGGSPKYVWPICSKSYNYEVQDGGQTVQPLNAEDYQFVGPHPSIPCDPISFDGSTYTHMDLPVNDDNSFDIVSFCVFIKATTNTGTVLHYQSDDRSQNIVMSLDSGNAVANYTSVSKSEIIRTNGVVVTNQWTRMCFVQKDSNAGTEILLTNNAVTNIEASSGSNVPSPLPIPGTIRIGSKLDGPETNFKGQMICLDMYDSEVSHGDYADSLNSCGGVSFPASSNLPTRPPPPPPPVCNVTAHKERHDTHFSRLENRMYVTNVNQLDQRNVIIFQRDVQLEIDAVERK